jgi:predicted HicB family RNase H-like nuclease
MKKSTDLHSERAEFRLSPKLKQKAERKADRQGQKFSAYVRTLIARDVNGA